MAVIRTHSRALRYRIEIGLDFACTTSGRRADRDAPSRENDVRALTQSLLTWFESPVRRHPDQWYMFRRFFSA